MASVSVGLFSGDAAFKANGNHFEYHSGRPRFRSSSIKCWLWRVFDDTKSRLTELRRGDHLAPS